jgi:drug/metabolite transporter (DMT)-like permease
VFDTRRPQLYFTSSLAVKDNPQEIGFIIGAVVGFIWLLWEGGRTTRSSGQANYIIVMICGGIGWGIGWIISRLF